ncbi:MAG: hypothetical protein IKZ55_07485 [Bacteroidales bacterium]|nr:hypothetical protein [Bacteroidales bacterium]
MKKLSLVASVVLALMLQACHFFRTHSEEVVVAECYGKYLYESDLKGIVPEHATVIDSIHRVNAFIDSWVKRQVLLHKAENNLSAADLDFSKQLEDYRNSLVIYTYETQLIRQKLDTVVGEAEIEAYYEENKDNFQVRSTLVRAAYVILEEDCKQKDQFHKLLSNRDTLMLQNIDMLANDQAVKCYLDVDEWIRLDELTKVVPIEIYNTESFLKKNKYVRFDWNDLTCMVRFEDYLLEKSVMPMELVRDNIKEILLIRRKTELIERMKEAIYEEAKRKHGFEVYVGQTTLAPSDSIN